MLQPGVAQEIEVRHAARGRHAGEKATFGRGRRGRVLLRSALERVVPVHRSLRSEPAGSCAASLQRSAEPECRQHATGPGKGAGFSPC